MRRSSAYGVGPACLRQRELILVEARIKALAQRMVARGRVDAQSVRYRPDSAE